LNLLAGGLLRDTRRFETTLLIFLVVAEVFAAWPRVQFLRDVLFRHLYLGPLDYQELLPLLLGLLYCAVVAREAVLSLLK
jgi:hypothetical protein